MYMMIMNFKKLFLKMYFYNKTNLKIGNEDIKLLVMSE